MKLDDRWQPIVGICTSKEGGWGFGQWGTREPSMLCKFGILDDLLCFVPRQTTSLLWSIHSYNRKPTANLTAIKTDWDEEHDKEEEKHQGQD